MALRKNLVANFIGQGWSGLIGLLFVPLYIRYLGMEAYGLIGMFAVLQVWLVLLDMGMAPTLNREMARFAAGAHAPQSIHDLLRSLELIALAVSIAIALALWAVADWLASNWLQAGQLPVSEVAQAIAIMGAVAALRVVEGIYRGALLGLQRQVFFNLANSALATLRAAGALAVLVWLAPTAAAFFLWQGLVSLAAVAVLGVATHRSLPAAPRPPRFSRQALLEIRNFAGGMMAVMLLALLLTQVDKILLSRMLTLEAFGYYALATAVSGGLTLLINPVSQAFYPRFSEMVARGDGEGLVRSYHLSAQLVSALVAPVALMLIFFGQEIMALWTGDAELARKVAPLLALLSLGNLLNGMMHIPYALQLAHGWPGLAVRMNLVAVLLLVPAILWATPRFGAVGAATVWVVLNAGYVLLGMQMMHGRLIADEKTRWYVQDVAGPALAAAAVMLACWSLQSTPEGKAHDLARLCINAFLAYAAAFMASGGLRGRALALLRRAHSVSAR